MPQYSGITSNLAERKAEHNRTKRGFRNWTVANGGQPFPSRQAAQAWEDRQSGAHHPGGGGATGPWYGYSFNYDG